MPLALAMGKNIAMAKARGILSPIWVITPTEQKLPEGSSGSLLSDLLGNLENLEHTHEPEHHSDQQDNPQHQEPKRRQTPKPQLESTKPTNPTPQVQHQNNRGALTPPNQQYEPGPPSTLNPTATTPETTHQTMEKKSRHGGKRVDIFLTDLTKEVQ